MPNLSNNLASKRPALRWHGGKWKLAPWIVGHFPPHRIYVEPFGGAASVLLRKARSYAEVYNDLDGDAVNFFRILRDPDSAARLEELLRLTPFSRLEFEEAYAPGDDPLERARCLAIRSFMGFGCRMNQASRTGFRNNTTRSGTTPAQDWMGYPDSIPALSARLQGVVIEDRPAIEVMQNHDGRESLHYVDPPYMPETRQDSCRAVYEHEMSAEDHESLLETLSGLDGMVALSGYDSDLYGRLLNGWHLFTKDTMADRASPRRECLWLNPHAAEKQAQLALL